METYIPYLLTTFGLTNALAFLHVGRPFRHAASGLTDAEFRTMADKGYLEGFRQCVIARMVRCHACMGFWMGCLLSPAYWAGPGTSPMVIIQHVSHDGLAASAFCFIVWVALWRLGAEKL